MDIMMSTGPVSGCRTVPNVSELPRLAIVFEDGGDGWRSA